MTPIRTTTDEQGQTLYALRDVAAQLGLTNIARLLYHIAPASRSTRNCGGRSTLIFVPRASLKPFQDRLDFNAVKSVASVPATKERRRVGSRAQPGLIRTILHATSGETLYSLNDIAALLHRQPAALIPMVKRDEIVKAQPYGSQPKLYAPKGAFEVLANIIDFSRATSPLDLNTSMFDQLVASSVRKIHHDKFPDCWEPLVPMVTVPGKGPQSLRRILYSLATGMELPKRVGRLRPAPHCWAKLGADSRQYISCCNPAHQTLEKREGGMKNKAASDAPDKAEQLQDLLIELLTDERPLDQWSAAEVREFAKDWALIPTEAVEAVIANLIEAQN